MIRARTLPSLRSVSLRTSPLSLSSQAEALPSSEASAPPAADDDPARQIVSILSQSSLWSRVIEMSDSIGKLTPSLVNSVIRSGGHLHPRTLLNFFYYSIAKMPKCQQKLDTHSILAVKLCNRRMQKHARMLLEGIIKFRPLPRSLLRCIQKNFSLEGANSNLAVFDELVDAYRKVNLTDAANVVFLMKDRNLAPTVRCCNRLLNDLFKANLMDLFWKVHEFMIDSQVGFDLCTYCIIMKGYFRKGDPESS